MKVTVTYQKQKWEYMHSPPEGTQEAKLTEVLKNPRDWL